MGPTGSGKSDLAEALADDLRGELINADAYQAYRGFTIGTAKPERAERYHLLNILDPSEPYGVGEFVVRASEAIRTIFSRIDTAIVVGGTGLYVRALMDGFDAMGAPPSPEVRAHYALRLESEGLAALVHELGQRNPTIAATTDLRNPRRVTRALERLDSLCQPIQADIPVCQRLKLGVHWSTDKLDARIAIRLDQMFQKGWLEEIHDLVANGVEKDAPAMDAIGYRALYDVAGGKASLAEARDNIYTATRQLAKRQRTWLRKEPNLHWIEPEPFESIVARAKHILNIF